MEHADGISPAWPIDYETLAPYYDAAERLYSVHGQSGIDPTEPPRSPYPHAPVPHAPRIAELVEALRARGLHPAPLPLGLREPGAPGGCVLCNTCNSFPCRLLAKSEADVCCVRPALTRPNVTLATRTLARRLLTDASGARVESVEVEHDGAVRRVKASVVVVSAGAVQSAALLLRSASDRHPGGLANSSDLVGRRYMAHLATMLQGFDPRRVNDTVFQKTVAINDFYFGAPNAPYPLGHIQSQGRTHGVMAQTVVPLVPLWAYNAWVARGVDWLVMSEDLPRFDNRVTIEPDGRIRLTYRPNNLGPHRMLVQRWSRLLKELGFWVVMKHGAAGRIGVLQSPAHLAQNTTHQCGTLAFGTDPRTSVLDPFCRSHDVENLFVVDASFFPSSAAVNPALTIIAQALRVADHIVDHRSSWRRLDRPGARSPEPGAQKERSSCEPVPSVTSASRSRTSTGPCGSTGRYSGARSSASRIRPSNACGRSSAWMPARPPARSAGSGCRGAACSEIFEFKPDSRRRRFRGTAWG